MTDDSSQPPPAQSPETPYVGLVPYGEADAAFFFGRDEESRIVAGNLRASGLTLLYGASGVGKSSLLRAGAIHELHELAREHASTKLERMRFAVCAFAAWRDDPLPALMETIRAAASEELGVDGLRAWVPGEPAADTLRAWTERVRTLLVVLDQFEDYFLYHPTEDGEETFAGAFPEIVNDPNLRVHFLLSIREDSLAKLDRFKGQIPRLFANYVRIEHLNRAAARRAIEGPIEEWNRRQSSAYTVEPALVEAVIDATASGGLVLGRGATEATSGDTDAERVEAPFLQLVMERLWRASLQAGGSQLTLSRLEELGGAGRIVENHLLEALGSLTSPEQAVAADIFRFLVTRSRTKIAHPASDLAEWTHHAEPEVEAVLDKLCRAESGRVLRRIPPPPTGDGETRYELFHDVLAQPVLAWSAERRTEREIERQLTERHQRRSRLQRLFAMGAAALAIVAVIIGFALVQRANAKERSREAEARSLDAAAVRQLEEDPELSLLLASESARSSPSPTAEDALRRSLLTSHVREVYETGGEITHVEFARDGRHVAFVSDDGQARVVESSGGRGVFRNVGPGGSVSFARKGGLVLLRGDAMPPRLVVSRNGELSCRLGSASAADATTVGEFAVVVRNGIGYVWRMGECALVHTIGRVGATAVRLVGSPDGRRVAFLSGREARIVDAESGRVAFRLEHPGEITSLAFSTDGRRIITGARDRLARIWNGFNGKLIHELAGHQGHVLDVAIGAGGAEVATASTDGTARIWDGVTGQLRAPLFGHTNFVRTVDFSPDGQSVVTASVDGTARTFGLNGRRLATLAGHTGAVADARFSPDGFTVLTGGEDGTVRIWEAGTRPTLARAELESPEAPVQVATSNDGRSKARVDDEVVRLEGADGSTHVLEGHRLAISSVGFSPDGKRLVTAGRDHDVILWDVESGNPLRVLRGHFGSVSDARFSPDGRWIVTAGPRSVGLWKAADGELTRLLVGPEGPYTAATFLADSRTIVAVTEAGVVSTYECRICGEIPELLDLADERLDATGRDLTPEERELYLD